MTKLLIAVDIAKEVFEAAIAQASGRILERRRITRSQFERFWINREVCPVVLEPVAAPTIGPGS